MSRPGGGHVLEDHGHPRPWSLAVQIMFGLLVAVTGYQYVLTVRNLEREDDDCLTARTTVVLHRVEVRPVDLAAFQLDVDASTVKVVDPVLLRVRTTSEEVETSAVADLIR